LECLRARNETREVRQRPRTLYYQAKEVKFSSRYDEVYREAVRWEAWRPVKANPGAPGVEGEPLEARVASGPERAMIERVPESLGQKTYRFPPGRRVALPKPPGGTRPLGVATEDRGVPTALKLGREPSLEADFQAGSYGYRPKREAQMASRASREDLYRPAWGGVEMDFPS
jgi:hypothetical protein